MRRSISPALALALLAAACSDSKTTPVGPGPGTDAAVTNKDATTTSTPADASTTPDANDLADTGNQGQPDAPPEADAGTANGPLCTELEACCGTLQFGQMQCFDRAAAGDENACQMLLQQAQQGGLCLPPGHDAGERPEGGALTPECAALAPCCAQAGALATICDNLVQGNDPARCQNILDLLAGRGIMCGPPDSGEPPDGGAPPVCQCDITVGVCDQNCPCDVECLNVDAGTSTVADVGP